MLCSALLVSALLNKNQAEQKILNINNIVKPESGVTMLNNIVLNNNEQ